jgi:hypothetical protein
MGELRGSGDFTENLLPPAPGTRVRPSDPVDDPQQAVMPVLVLRRAQQDMRPDVSVRARMLGNLQVLRRCQRVSEPGDVGHVHQQRRGRQRADDLAAKGVFVADVHPHALAGKAQRRLRG